MKRTLTAATTLLVGSAGAIGFAGTAAADTNNLAAELGLEEEVKQVAFQVASGARSAAITAHSAKTVVGDVVPMEQGVTQTLPRRAGTRDVLGNLPTTMATKTVGDLAGARKAGDATTLPAGQVTDVLGGSPGGQATGILGSLPGGKVTEALGGDVRTGAVDEALDTVDRGAPVGNVTGRLDRLTSRNRTPLSGLPLGGLPLGGLPLG